DGLGRDWHPSSGGDEVARTNQRLTGDAPVEPALPAHQPLLDDGRGHATLDGTARGVLARWPGADHDHVELVHGTSFLSRSKERATNGNTRTESSPAATRAAPVPGLISPRSTPIRTAAKMNSSDVDCNSAAAAVGRLPTTGR